MKQLAFVILFFALILGSDARAKCCKLKAPKIITKAVSSIVKAPAKVVRETARTIEKTTGGDVSEFAGKTRKEADRAVTNVGIAVNGAAAAVESLNHKPLDGVARIAACGATLCASEVVAYKRSREVAGKKMAESQRRIAEAEKANVQALKDTLGNEIAGLREDKMYLEAQRSVLEKLIQLSTSIRDNTMTRPEIPDRFRHFVTPKNMELIGVYLALLERQMSDVKITDEQYKAYLQLESQVLEAAKLSGEDYNTFLHAVLAGISNEKNYALKLESLNGELMPELQQAYALTEKTILDLESKIIELETKQKAL